MKTLRQAAGVAFLVSLATAACNTASVAQTPAQAPAPSAAPLLAQTPAQTPAAPLPAPTPLMKDKPAMDNTPSASRPAPPRVLPVEHQGVRYMQDLQAFRHGGTQRGGYLVAVDPKTGERLWMLKIYPVADHSAAAVESPGIYFRSLKLASSGAELEIENEVGGKYLVDLSKRSAAWLSGPESGKP